MKIDTKWITLIHEVHCYPVTPVGEDKEKSNQATLWIFGGRLSQSGLYKGYIESVPGARKVVGPVNKEIVEEAEKSITQALKDAYISVETEMECDD